MRMMIAVFLGVLHGLSALVWITFFWLGHNVSFLSAVYAGETESQGETKPPEVKKKSEHRAKGKAKSETKEDEGTSAPPARQIDPEVPKSKYQLDGQSLEVDTD